MMRAAAAADWRLAMREEDKYSSKATANQPDEFDIDIQACSSTDCTGLIPALPYTDEEKEAYEDLYPYITHAVNRAGDE